MLDHDALTRARTTDDHGDLALPGGEVYAFEDISLAKGLPNLIHGHHRF